MNNSMDHLPHCRWLTASDEPQFQDLLKEVYQDTYNYRFLYQNGGFASLLESRKLDSLGEFNASGRLLSHTAFLFKDCGRDFLEQGLAFKSPTKPIAASQARASLFDFVRKQYSKEYSFLHQNVTTYHLAAQAFSKRYLKSFSTGFIVNYANEERLSGIHHPRGPMHALVLTSHLSTIETKELLIPKGSWGDWLEAWLTQWPIPRTTKRVPIEKTRRNLESLSLETIEVNPWLEMLRQRVIEQANHQQLSVQTNEIAVDLVHLPLVCESTLSRSFPALINSGYVPVGIRPYQSRPDEIVFQKILDKIDPNVLNQAKFASKSDQTQCRDWILLCQ